jgi:hypothetical protein
MKKTLNFKKFLELKFMDYVTVLSVAQTVVLKLLELTVNNNTFCFATVDKSILLCNCLQLILRATGCKTL